MKRFHTHVGVKSIEKSVQFYSTLFGQKPTKLKEDYAESKKAWVQDPSGIAWETYQNMGDVEIFSSQSDPTAVNKVDASCCVPSESETECCGSSSL